MSIDPSELIVISKSESGERLDKILANRYREVQSRAYFQKLIEEKRVLLNGEPIKKRMKPEVGDEVEIFFLITPEINITPENIPLEVLYEDSHLLVINKPVGMVVHPAPGHWSGTFVNALLYHCQQELPDAPTSINSPFPRPGIVHRLDKDTTGVLVAAKTATAHQRLIELFSGRQVHKEYLAICVGNPGSGVINQPIGRHPIHRQKMTIREEGKSAVTKVNTLSFDGKLSVVALVIETGRTHQVRVHMQHRGTPVLGDSVYGNSQMNTKFHADRQLLHAHRMRLNHPITGEELQFEAPIPEDIDRFMKIC